MAEHLLKGCPSPGCVGKPPKLYYNDAKKKGWCHRCSRAFSEWDIKNLGLLRRGSTNRYESSAVVPPPLVSAWEDPAARRYLEGRRVFPGDCPEVMYDPRDRRLYFPIWSPAQEYTPSWHTRGIVKEDGWRVFPGTNKQNYVYGTMRHDTPPSRLVLVEGIFDALRIGPGTLSLLGVKLYPLLRAWLRPSCRVLIWMDKEDAAGQAAEAELEQVLDRLNIPSAIFRAPSEPAEMSPSGRHVSAVRAWLKG